MWRMWRLITLTKRKLSKIKKIAQLVFLAFFTALFGLLSVVLFLTGEDVSVQGGISFLIPTVIFVGCFFAVLYDKG